MLCNYTDGPSWNSMDCLTGLTHLGTSDETWCSAAVIECFMFLVNSAFKTRNTSLNSFGFITAIRSSGNTMGWKSVGSMNGLSFAGFLSLVVPFPFLNSFKYEIIKINSCFSGRVQFHCVTLVYLFFNGVKFPFVSKKQKTNKEYKITLNLKDRLVIY
jgi:hypothetical protein